MVRKDYEEKWKLRLKELKAYKQKHGDCLVPQNYEHNPKLGNWVGHQRQEYKKWLKGVYAKITQERIDQLNEIDFVWVVGSHQPDDTLWKQQFNKLVKYKEKHGDCLVSTLDEHNAQLGNWVHHQRREYKKWLKGVNACITQDRIDQLNEIDFVWEVGIRGRKDDTLWKLRLEELVKYKKKHGDCRVSKHDKQNRKLGIWVLHQRTEYKKWLKGENAFITQDRIDQLNEIDFIWEVSDGFRQKYQFQRDNTLWKQRLKELKTYKKKHGDCLVPAKYKHNRKLGRWVDTQRQQYQKWLKGLKASITQERIDQLNEIDFAWEGERNKFKKKPKDDTLWKKHFNELVKYKKKHGDCLVPQKYKRNAKLGRWVGTQRLQYKKWLKGVHPQLTQERIDQLNEIDFVWDARFERKTNESNRSNREISIPSVDHYNVASTKTKSNRPRKRRMSSKDRPKKRRRRQQSQDIDRELSPSERKARRRLMLRALYNCRNPMRPDEVVSV